MKSRALLVLLAGAMLVVGTGVVWEVVAGRDWAKAGASAGAVADSAVTSGPDRPGGSMHSTMHLGRVEVVTPSTPPDATYSTRGRIEGMPEATLRPGGVIYLQLHHEEIPEFVGPKGEVDGMQEMIMDFPTIAANVSWEELRLGDPVALTFEVRWTSNPRFILTSLTRLPDDAPLRLSEVERNP